MEILSILRYILLYFGNLIGERPVVKTSLGWLQGSIMQTMEGRNIYAFRGIPYGRSPVGKFRFQPPRPAKRWKGIFDASKDAPGCMQKGGLIFEKKNGVEDCLKLNVYTPLTPNVMGKIQGNLTVMVFIYGGSFISGTSKSFFYNPGFLLDHDVVLVTINYRLGAFGFLSTEDKLVPGNNGLRDQILALQWVKKHIASFGGNPDEVTIFGESAGAISVHLLMISPLSRGLFKRAISQSGVAICPTYRYAKTVGRKSKELALILSCPTHSSLKMIKCLQRIPAEKLVKYQSYLYVSRHRGSKTSETKFQEWGVFPFPFVPRVDIESSNPVIPEDPLEILLKGNFSRVPWMLGMNKEEGIYWSIQKQNPSFLLSKVPAEEFERICGTFTGLTNENRSHQCISAFHLYLKANSAVTKYQVFEKFSADSFFNAPIRYAQRIHSKLSPTYAYVLSFKGRFSIANIISILSFFIEEGVTHADDLLYLFGPTIYNPFSRHSPEYKFVKIMTKYWVDFARTGNPNEKNSFMLKWEPFEPNTEKHLNLDLNLTMGERYKQGIVEFWRKAYKWPELH